MSIICNVTMNILCVYVLQTKEKVSFVNNLSIHCNDWNIEGLINVMSFEYVYRMSNKQLERKWEVINPQGFIIISWTSILRDFMTGLIQKFKYTLKSKPDNNLFGKSIVQNFYRSLKLRIVINVWKLISINFQWNLGNENFTCLTNRFI